MFLAPYSHTLWQV